MAKTDHVIVGIHVRDRVHRAPDLQKTLTDHGCNIKTRLGLHEVSDDFCAASGIILLEVVGDQAKIDQLLTALKAFDEFDVDTMVFSHD